MKHQFTLVSIMIGMLILARPVMAQSLPMAEMSAAPILPEKVWDPRIARLETYLTAHGSPMSDQAEHFITEADRLALDWRLVAAIAGVESTFGKHVPSGSYNGWGWGIFTGATDGVHFTDWKNGITVVSEGLKYRYIDKGAVTVEQIGAIYASSPVWSYKVHHILDDIAQFEAIGIRHLAVTI